MVFHASKAGERQLPQENNSPLTTNVGFRGIQALRDELGEASFRPEEKIRTYEGTLGYLMATSPEHLFAARRGMFPMPSSPRFLLQYAWDAMALWTRATRASRKPGISKAGEFVIGSASCIRQARVRACRIGRSQGR
ncbi:hypothetical protein ERJ75_000340300 [Trypanosoma vivax]|nr:hypothetical protein ERJ75_000340300 [Trypanosoma vivax]